MEVEEREMFLNNLDGVVDRVDNGYKLCVPGDLNGWNGDRLRVGIVGRFKVLGENEKGRKVTDFCGENGLCVHKSTYVH